MCKKTYHPRTTSTVLQCFVIPNKGQRMKPRAAKGEAFRITPEGMRGKKESYVMLGACVSECKHVQAVELQIHTRVNYVRLFTFKLHASTIL